MQSTRSLSPHPSSARRGSTRRIPVEPRRSRPTAVLWTPGRGETEISLVDEVHYLPRPAPAATGLSIAQTLLLLAGTSVVTLTGIAAYFALR